ncbi:MAG TPA: FtsQ-type POTRA domain-containing protein [Ktedonosporobacter sp.]|nr:FtsQ-type POTRA domain-containing protein [Ktedonosporobacter sp.]
MTEKKRLPEQIASHTYRQAISAERRAGAQRGPSPARKSETSRDVVRYERRSLQRVVTVPQSDPSVAWNDFAQRQQQRRQARSRPQKYSESAPRTLAQTGVRASSGRIRAVRPSLQPASPIPARSGRRAIRRGFLWKLLSFFALAIVLALGVNFALTSNAFRIEQVNVLGTHNEALKHTIQRMGMQGQNIFLISVASLTDRIQALPLVASASLSKQLPNQLAVTVVERTPVLLWQTAQGTYSVDNQGVVIAPLSETAGAEHLSTVVVLTAQSVGQGAQKGLGVRPGTRLNAADIAFAEEVFARVPAMLGITTFGLQYDGTMYASTSDDSGGVNGKGAYILASSDGWKAYLGSAYDANPLDNRLIELQQILALAQKEQLNLATIDVRYGLRPVYTLKS